MIVQYLDYMVTEMLPGFFSLLASLEVGSGVNLLSFIVACILMCIVIGSLILRP